MRLYLATSADNPMVVRWPKYFVILSSRTDWTGSLCQCQTGVRFLSPPTHTNIITHNTPQGWAVPHILAKTYLNSDLASIQTHHLIQDYYSVKAGADNWAPNMICRRNVPDNNLLSDPRRRWVVCGWVSAEWENVSDCQKVEAGQRWCKLKSHHFLAWQLLTLILHKAKQTMPSSHPLLY